jgi:hypothetical protein
MSNIYINEIKLVALNNKYTRWYINLIESRYFYAPNKYNKRVMGKNMYGPGNSECHHIFPVSLCSTDEMKNDPCNLVVLTHREHFIAHRLLSKMFSDVRIKSKMVNAITMFQRSYDRALTSWQYAIARTEATKLLNARNTLTGETDRLLREYIDGVIWVNAATGRKHSEKSKRLISERQRGVPKPREHVEKIAAKRRGMPLGPQSPAHSDKIRQKLIGRKPSNVLLFNRRRKKVVEIISNNHVNSWEEFVQLFKQTYANTKSINKTRILLKIDHDTAVGFTYDCILENYEDHNLVPRAYGFKNPNMA